MLSLTGSLLAALFIHLRMQRQAVALVDFIVFWAAARAPRNAIYDVEALTAAQAPYIPGLNVLRPFPYPPSALPWLEPLSWLPLVPAGALWGVLGLAIFLLAARRFSWPAALLAGLSPTVIQSLVYGQMSLFLGAMLLSGLFALSARPRLAGVLFGIVATIKPQAVLLLPVALIASRHRRALACAISTGIAVGIVSLLIHNRLWLDWLTAASDFLDIAREVGVLRVGVSPLSLAARHGLTPPATAGFVLLCGLAGVALVWRTFRTTVDNRFRLLALVLGGAMVSPYAMPYDLAMMGPASAALLLDRRQHPLSWIFAFFAFCTFAGGWSVLGLGLALLLAPRSLLHAEWLDAHGVNCDGSDATAFPAERAPSQ